MGAGRPSDYSAELADRICEELASGKSLREICRADDTPKPATVYRWLDANEQFREQYARARDAQADHIAEECVTIADDGTNDWMARNDPENPGYEFNGEHVQRSRLRVDARKWFAGKVAPKKYGDRVGHDVNTNINLAFAINAAPVSRIAADVERTAGQRADGLLSHDGANGFVLSAPLPSETGGSGK